MNIEERRIKIAIAVFVAVAAFGILFPFSAYADRKTEIISGIEKQQQEAQEEQAVQQEYIQPRSRVTYEAGDLRDPFDAYLKEEQGYQQTSTAAPVELPALTIQGVIWGAKFPQAIINNKVVKVGDIINLGEQAAPATPEEAASQEIKILNITRENITLFYQSRQFVLPSPAGVAIQNLKKEPEGGKDEKK
jgi:hypothetical protein